MKKIGMGILMATLLMSGCSHTNEDEQYRKDHGITDIDRKSVV